MGYIYANDEDDAAGWQAVAGASPDVQNLAAPWMRMQFLDDRANHELHYTIENPANHR